MTIKQFTNQEVFDKVAIHLAQQKVASMRETVLKTMSCTYRGDNGTRCAMGIFITNETYHSKFENHRIDQLGITLLRKWGLGDATPRLLGRLQSVHDSRPPDKWAVELEGVACTFNLFFDYDKFEKELNSN